MEVNKLETKEVLIMLFGVPVMITLIVLVSITMGHWVTARSDRPTNVTVAAAAPKIEMNVPPAAPPQVNVSASPANVEVKMPEMPPPSVQVNTPPAVVTVVHRSDLFPFEARPAALRVDANEPPAPPAALAPASPIPTAPALVKVPEQPQPRKEAAPASKAAGAVAVPPVPAAAPAKDVKPAKEPPKTDGVAPLKDEDLTLDTLYKYAEKYIESYCAKRSLDPVAEARKWNNGWKQNVEQSLRDNTDSDEQAYLNRTVIAKRDCFDIEKATPEKIVEGCRIMLRYRDGQFAWLQAMRDAVTNENMKKTLVFLAAGVK
ncbi:MAG TPA: hypothetical protein VGP72_04940 [Planctomycetota bacterium]|jgi:hypothetical protein